jgi:hypothetical protein
MKMWHSSNILKQPMQNLIHEGIKSRLVLGNAHYQSVQNLLSSHLLSKNVKIRIYKTIILPVVLYGCETWSLTLRKEHKTEGVSEQGAENIQTQEGLNKRLDKSA